MIETDPCLAGQNIPCISDEMLNQMVNAISFSADHEIARLVTVIKNVRSFKQGLATSDLALQHASEEYDQVLCLSLYRALQQVNALDSAKGVRVSVLQRLWKYQQIPLLNSGARAGED